MIAQHQTRYGRLVLSRQVGQTVHLDTVDRRITLRVMSVDPLRLSITGAKANTAIGFYDGRLAWNTLCEIFAIEGLIKIEAKSKYAPGWAKLCITAPRGVKITRGELEHGSSTETEQ